MPTQSSSLNIPRYLDIGNALLYISKSSKTTFSSAESATDYRKLGILRNGLQLDTSRAIVDIKSGVPQVLAARFYTEETLKISGEMLEFSPFNYSRAFGGLGLTVTTKASSPSPTTVATGSTKSVVNVASATGYAAGDLLEVGNSGSKQYGVIKSISSNALTLVEDLDNDTNPTTGHAVAKVDKVKMDGGSVSTPTRVSLKIVKTLVGGFGTLSLYLLNAGAEGNATIQWSDNGNVDPAGIPFSFEAFGDPNVESGALWRAVFTQS